MLRVLVTGANGFVGRNLVTALLRRGGEDAVQIETFTSQDSRDVLDERVACADVVFHLAGANRPPREADFAIINTELTGEIVRIAETLDRPPAIVFASSTQATRDNPYGRSKLAAENLLNDYYQRTGNPISVYRLPNVFGKWSKPNYNSVVATFCHNVARGLEIQVNDPNHELTLVYVDEVVRCLSRHLDRDHSIGVDAAVDETFKTTVGELASTIQALSEVRMTLKVPDVSHELTRYLYSTYLSFLPRDQFSYDVELRTDDRGWLFELIKSDSFGQMFVSTTKPGITRGNHYHDTKIEKFCLIQGRGLIRFRLLDAEEVIEYPVTDQQIQVVDIPPGYTHSIQNVGESNMIVLFWANEVFDPEQPDTYWVPVQQE